MIFLFPFGGICLNSFPANVPSATRFPCLPFPIPISTFLVWKRSGKAACSLEQPAGVGPLPNPLIRCGKKNPVSDQPPFTSCLEETPVQFDKKSAQLVKSLKSRTYVLFISSNFCEIQRKSAAGRLLARFNSIQLGFLTRFQTPLLWSCSRRLTIPGSLSDPNDGTVSQRNQHFHFLRWERTKARSLDEKKHSSVLIKNLLLSVVALPHFVYHQYHLAKHQTIHFPSDKQNLHWTFDFSAVPRSPLATSNIHHVLLKEHIHDFAAVKGKIFLWAALNK